MESMLASLKGMFAPPPKPAEGDVAANAAATGRNLLNLGQAVGKARAGAWDLESPRPASA